jgi:ATP-dependent Clp protease ATP-binding subunit ClpA
MVRQRRPVVDREISTYAEMAARVEEGIRDYFVLQLGRPELLNRIGDNIIVFDYIDTKTGTKILHLMIENIVARVRQEHHVEVSCSTETVILLEEHCLDGGTLQLGGRGIGSQLETALVNPLANALFLERPTSGSIMIIELSLEGDQWTASLIFQ